MQVSSAQSQPQPPSMVTSAPRPLQLDQWANTKAPLTSSQRASVNRLAEWLHRNSSDFKQQHQHQHQHQHQQPSHPFPSGQTASSDATALEHVSELTPDNAHAKNAQSSTSSSDPIALPDASAPLVSAQSFLAWYTQLSDSVTSSTQTSHLQGLQRISHTTSVADHLLAQLEACQLNVSELRAGTAFVQDSSRGIREQAQALLDSQTHLDTLAQDVASRLSFFTLLPYATNMLSSPHSSIVYSQSFLELMHQLDMALLFLHQYPARSYRDAALYRMRYSQCVIRAATLAKIAVVRHIKSEADNVAERVKLLESNRNPVHPNTPTTTPTSDLKGKAPQPVHNTQSPPHTSRLPNHTAHALFADASHQVTKLRPLIFELQKRATNSVASSTPNPSTAAEFESLLHECRSAWFQHRKPLLSRVLLHRFAQLEAHAASASLGDGALQSLVQVARLGTSLVRTVLQSEYELYHRFFGGDSNSRSTGADGANSDTEWEAGLGAYLAELVETVGARLRPKLAKQDDVLVLVHVSSAIAEAVDASELDGAVWKRCLLPLLNEAQSRLVLRAQSIVSSHIAQFIPSEHDGQLDFPERIRQYKASSANQLSETAQVAGKAAHRRRRSGAGLLDAALSASHAASSSKTQQEKVQLFTLPPALRSTYYQPVGVMLELLYHLQARVSASGFRRIATAAVDACLASVAKGSHALVNRKSGDSLEREDAWLFELRHLEILREAVVSAQLVLSQAHDQTIGTGTGVNRLNQSSTDVGSGTPSLVNLSALVLAINSLWTNTGRLLYPSTTSPANADSEAAPQLDMEACSTNVEHRLHTLVAQIATLWSDSIVLPLRVYIDQRSVDKSGNKFESTYHAFETCIESVIPEKAAKVALWVEDREVQRWIVRSVTDKVGEVYARFYEMRVGEERKVETVEGIAARVRGVWDDVLGV